MTDAELATKTAEAGGRVFIGFKDSNAVAGVDETGGVLASTSSVAAAKVRLRALGAVLEFEFTDMPTVIARISSSLVPELRHDALIEYIEPIFPGIYNDQITTWNVQRVNAPAAWSYSTGAGAKLLITDSGIDDTQQDLAPAVVQTCVPYPDAGIDELGHGTAVAGIAAAVNNSIQVVGAAYGVALWSSKIGSTALDPGYAACAVQFGRTNHVQAISMSITVPPYTALTDQINAAYNQDDIVIVVGAGNSNGGAVTYPATLDAAIAVSAMDTNNNFAPFSAAGAKVELAAPGTTVTGQRGITTTCLGGGFGDSCGFLVEGTSFSTPHVAAAAALLKAYNPTWSNVEVRRRLGAGATDLGAVGRDAQFGYGLLNIVGAIGAPSALSVSISGLNWIKTPGTYTWTCNASGGTGTYSYLLERSDLGGPYYSAGSTSSYSASFDAGSSGYFDLRCTVTSGTQTTSATKHVSIAIPD